MFITTCTQAWRFLHCYIAIQTKNFFFLSSLANFTNSQIWMAALTKKTIPTSYIPALFVYCIRLYFSVPNFKIIAHYCAYVVYNHAILLSNKQYLCALIKSHYCNIIKSTQLPLMLYLIYFMQSVHQNRTFKFPDLKIVWIIFFVYKTTLFRFQRKIIVFGIMFRYYSLL